MHRFDNNYYLIIVVSDDNDRITTDIRDIFFNLP